MVEMLEKRRLLKLLIEHRDCLRLLLAEAASYTDGQECVFCSGYDGYESPSTHYRDDIKHSRKCVTRRAHKLLTEEV